MPQVRLHHVAIPIPFDAHDIARTFYSDVLGLPEKVPPHTLVHRKLIWYDLGDDKELHLFPSNNHTSADEMHHLCLVVEDDDVLEEFRTHLTKAGVDIEAAPRIPTRNRFYVRDPFHNRVEISTIEGDYRETE